MVIEPAANAVPVAPGTLPGIGHGLRLVRGPLAFLESFRSHGDMVQFRIGKFHIHLVNSPELIHRVLVTDAGEFTQGRLYDSMRPLFGSSLIVADGENHLHLHRIMIPAFHRKRLNEYVTLMRQNTEETISGWTPGRQLTVYRAMCWLTCANTVGTLFGTKPCRATLETIETTLPAITKGTLLRTVMPFGLLDRVPTSENRSFRAAIDRMRDITAELIANYNAHEDDRENMLSALLNANDMDTGEPLSQQQIGEQVVTFLLAGTETTATALAWFFTELCRHPQIEQTLHAEIDRVLCGRPVNFESLLRLEYTRLVITETLRLHPPICAIMRRATTRIVLGGMELPPGADLLISPLTVHRDPSLYPRPERFDPDRWRHTIPGKAFLPFGAGTHKCIGNHFALTEMTVVVATICNRWRLVPSPDTTLRPTLATILLPNDPPMTLRPRLPNAAKLGTEP